MKLPKINIKGIAVKAAGHAAGLALVTQFNRIPAVQKIAKPELKGLITAAIGYVVVPAILQTAGLKGSSKGDFSEAVGEGMGVFGIAQLANTVAPNIFPKVSGIEGYEADPFVNGLAAVDEEYLGDTELDGIDGVEGYEADPFM